MHTSKRHADVRTPAHMTPNWQVAHAVNFENPHQHPQVRANSPAATLFAKATHSDRYLRSSSPLLQIAVKRHLFLPSAADHIPPRCGVDSHALYGGGQTKVWFPIERVTGNWTGLCGDRVVNGEEPAG